MSVSNVEFNARIARIKAGQASSKSTLFVGMDEVYQITYPRRGKQNAAVSAVSGALFPVFLLVAVVAGVAAFAAAAWVRYRMLGFGIGGGDPLTEMGIQAGAALAMAVFFNLILKFRARGLRVALGIAAVSTTFIFHNAVHMYPEQFMTAFSPDWVNAVISSTKPQSVLWQGRSYTL